MNCTAIIKIDVFSLNPSVNPMAKPGRLAGRVMKTNKGDNLLCIGLLGVAVKIARVPNTR
jgi:hypothetical protein